MNLFLLDDNMIAAARAHVDRHVVKMPLEAAQLLCSCFPPGAAPYKPTHIAHPLVVWTRASTGNFGLVVEYGLAVADEYARRYGREHASRAVIVWCAERCPVPAGALAEPVQCMPDEFQVPGDHVAAYRAYYRARKAHLASWRAPAAPPSWWVSPRS